MKTKQTPLWMTIFFGMVCGIIFIPASTVLSRFLYSPMPFRVIIFLYLAVYSVFLVRWGKKKLTALFIPFMLLLVLSYVIPGNKIFLFASLFILSWIRSGICFPGSIVKTGLAELVICFGGGFFTYCFSPHTLLTWSLAIWLFFLFQSIYFVLFADEAGISMAGKISDPFEHARKRAEKILSESV